MGGQNAILMNSEALENVFIIFLIYITHVHFYKIM